MGVVERPRLPGGQPVDEHTHQHDAEHERYHRGGKGHGRGLRPSGDGQDPGEPEQQDHCRTCPAPPVFKDPRCGRHHSDDEDH